jgi:hypothetical protein
MARHKSKQNAHKSEVKTPKAAEIECKKAAFLQELRAASGNVSKAVEKSGLNRRTAYEHLAKDREFGDAWREVLAIVSDELLAELRRRALGYDIGPDGAKRYCKSNDRVLIYLHQKIHTKNKWRGRVLETATAALEVIAEDGAKAGLSKEQLCLLREALIKRYESVSLD